MRIFDRCVLRQRLRINPLCDLGLRLGGQIFETGASSFFRSTLPNDPGRCFYEIVSVRQLKAHYRKVITLESFGCTNAEPSPTEIGHETAITVAKLHVGGGGHGEARLGALS